MDFKDYDRILEKLDNEIIKHEKIVAKLMEQRKNLFLEEEEEEPSFDSFNKTKEEFLKEYWWGYGKEEEKEFKEKVLTIALKGFTNDLVKEQCRKFNKEIYQAGEKEKKT